MSADLKVIKGVLHKLVYRKFIKKAGRIIYPKKAKAFKFWVPVTKAV